MRIIQGREAFKFYLTRNIKINQVTKKKVSEQELTEILSCIGISPTSIFIETELENFCFSFQKLGLSEWLVTIKPL